MRVEVVVEREAALPGVRAFLSLRRAAELGAVSAVAPPETSFQAESFTGSFSFELRSERSAADLREQLLARGRAGERHAARGRGRGRRPDRLPVAAAGGTSARGRQVRVDPARLDVLMNQAGELVILRDRLRQLVSGRDAGELDEVVDQVSRLIDELQGEIMRVRMVAVAQVFDRFPRLVRDAAQALGKRVDFRVDGQDLEFDRAMLDEMSDPIVHLLRNALDHGIEDPAARRAAGKPEVATLGCWPRASARAR